MAIVHRATIKPTKLELLDAWLGDDLPGSEELRLVGSYRFDDPDGEVGIESLLVTRDGPVRQAVLTYRAAPLEGAEAHLITTMEHSALGTRWIYDAQGDPVALAAFQRALAGQQDQASMEVYDGETLVATREPNLELVLNNAADSPEGLDVKFATLLEAGGSGETGGPSLVARWDGGEGVVAWA